MINVWVICFMLKPHCAEDNLQNVLLHRAACENIHHYTFAPLCLLCRLFSMMVRCSVAMNYGMAFSPPLLSGPVYPDIKGSNRGSIEAPLLSIWRTDAALIMTITQIL